MPWGKRCSPRVRRLHKLPAVLSPEEVSRFFEHVGCLKHRAALILCYGAGLRISEAVKIRIGDIDSDRMMILRRFTAGSAGSETTPCRTSRSNNRCRLDRSFSRGPPTSCTRSKVRLKQLSSNLPGLHSTSGQPVAEIGDQTNLHLTRLPGVSLATHLGSVGIDIRSGGRPAYTYGVP